MQHLARIPYRITTPRLVLRPYDHTDAENLRTGLARSKEHLARFLAWAAFEPQSLDEKYASIRRLRGQFELDVDHTYGVFLADGVTIVGGTGLHSRIGPGAKEIGYWTHVDHTRRGYASEATAALTKVGFELLGVRKIEIRVQPENVESLNVPRKLGYRDTGLLRSVCPGACGTAYHDAHVFSLLASEYPETSSARLELRAFDGLSRELTGAAPAENTVP
jgi:RimJ/RimL family protein N-acetyltransferase